jgi:hypothetical protein
LSPDAAVEVVEQSRTARWDLFGANLERKMKYEKYSREYWGLIFSPPRFQAEK